MGKLILALFTGLVGAAVLHILIILVLPLNATSDSWSRVTALGEPFKFFILANQDNPTGLYNEDIHIQTAVCHYDLEEGPLQVIADDPTSMWTIALYDPNSNEIFSMSARSSIGGEVDFIVGTKGQLLNLRSEEPDLMDNTIAVEVGDLRGYIALRSIVASLSSLPEARGFLADATCGRL